MTLVRRWPGFWLAGVAVLHLGTGLLMQRDALATLVARGLIDAPAGDARLMTFAWFMLFGFLTLIAGLAIARIEEVDVVPAHIAWCIAALALAGVVLMPRSGFWLVTFGSRAGGTQHERTGTGSSA